MKKLLLLLPLLLLAGCAGLSTRDESILRERGVPPPLVARMRYGDPLSATDIIILSRRDVPRWIILRYIDDNNAGMRYTRADIVRMREAGVDDAIIDDLLSVQRHYVTVVGGPVVYPYPYGPYYNDPFYYPGPVVYRSWGFGGGWHGDGWHHHHRD